MHATNLKYTASTCCVNANHKFIMLWKSCLDYYLKSLECIYIVSISVQRVNLSIAWISYLYLSNHSLVPVTVYSAPVNILSLELSPPAYWFPILQSIPLSLQLSLVPCIHCQHLHPISTHTRATDHHMLQAMWLVRILKRPNQMSRCTQNLTSILAKSA